MRALVIANGELPSAACIQELARQADLVVATDGAGPRALALGCPLSAIVGDLDSLDPAGRTELGDIPIVELPDPDRTDLEKAVQWAIDRGCTEVDVVGFGGGRADHALANYSVLVTFRRRARVRLRDDLFTISLVEGEATIVGEPGTVVSLVALGRCEGVSTRGLRWELREATLTFSSLGIHNELRSSPAWVRVRSGDLLLFRGHWAERHR